MKLKLNFSFILLCIISLQLIQGLIFPSITFGQSKVFVMEIKDEINPAAERYTKLALEEAAQMDADYVLIEMNTFGGRVDNADAIRQNILDCKIPVFVFINRNAASAGALISIACDKIYMAEGATIGAATVVTGDGNKADGKYQSYMVEKMRSTAEATGRDPEIAAAMVDEKIQVDSAAQQGKVLTMSTEKAIAKKFIDGQADNLEEILKTNNIKEYELVYYESNFTEKIVHLFLNPYLSGILLLILLGGIYFELQTPGVGFPLIAAIIAGLLYFIPYYLVGLAENWEVLMLFIGIILLLIELFMIPGFGVTGFSGIGIMLTALVLMMLGNDGFDFSNVTMNELYASLITVVIGLFGATALIAYAIPKLLRSKRFSRIALQQVMDKEDGYTANAHVKRYIGKTGIAYTVLRPSGKIMIEDVLYDASTRGDFIEKGEEIVVISQEGTSLRVKKVEEPKV